MKVYMFFLKITRDELINAFWLSEYAPEDDGKLKLYAHTNDFSIANEFIKTRNMRRFLLRIDKVSKDEYKEFCRKHFLQKLEIKEYYMSEKKYCTITSTKSEEDSVNEAVDTELQDDIMQVTKTPYTIFKDKYKKALDILNYNYNHEIHYDWDDMKDHNLSFGVTCGFNNGVVEPNQLNTFINIFKILLK